MRSVTSRDLRRTLEAYESRALKISINFPNGAQLAKGSTIEAEITPDDDNNIVVIEGSQAWILARAIETSPICTRDPNTCQVAFCGWPHKCDEDSASSSSLGIERLEQLILATPTGPLRNELCDINILIQSQNLSYE